MSKRNQTIESADTGRRALLTWAATASALSAAGACAAATDGREPPADLVEAVRAYDRATIANDIDALAEIVADDYMLVNSDASVQGKRDYLADFNLPGFHIDPYVMQEPVQRVLGDAALTGGRLHLSWTQDGERHTRQLRIIHVWTRQGGRWRIAYTQLTRIAE
jgi:ketosteroid isomerase-like protein